MSSHNGNKKDKSFNDKMMTWIGVPIVWGWLLAALTIVFQGIRDPDSVMPMLEGFISLLAIVGTLATLIVTSMLELWKSEQQKEVEVIPVRLEHAVALNAEERRHRMEIDTIKTAHEVGATHIVEKHFAHIDDSGDSE
jgi:hypothetical protein|tara:strand:+ start:51780 stop:52193 length:414 start_codon:yes stop_codon:yes gene_type:complete